MLGALAGGANAIGPVIFLLLIALVLICCREGLVKYVCSNVRWLCTNTITRVGYMAWMTSVTGESIKPKWGCSYPKCSICRPKSGLGIGPCCTGDWRGKIYSEENSLKSKYPWLVDNADRVVQKHLPGADNTQLQIPQAGLVSAPLESGDVSH